jgi:hypothetical protein
MMRVTGVTDGGRLGHYLRVMQELGYIKLKGLNIAELCINFESPYYFPSDGKKGVVKPQAVEEFNSELERMRGAKVVKPGPGESAVHDRGDMEKKKKEEVARRVSKTERSKK